MALLSLFPVKKTGFSLDAVVLFPTEKDNREMDGHIQSLCTFLLNI